MDLKQVTAADQIWATDITYIPLQKGFLYLVAIVDLFSRNVLSWKLSNKLIQLCRHILTPFQFSYPISPRSGWGKENKKLALVNTCGDSTKQYS